jgi:hypothetical protein
MIAQIRWACRALATTMALSLLLAAPAAQAVLVDSAGDSFTVEWLLADGATDPNGNTNGTGVDIAAEATFSLSAYDTAADSIGLSITATNTTVPNSKAIGLHKLGFGTTPDVTGVTFSDDADGGFIGASLGGFSALPNAALIDVTAATGPGAPNTLQAGDSDTFGLTLSFANLTSDGVDFGPFDAFFQSNPQSFQVPANGNGSEVPAPGTLALLGTGLLALGWVGRRRGMAG